MTSRSAYGGSPLRALCSMGAGRRACRRIGGPGSSSEPWTSRRSGNALSCGSAARSAEKTTCSQQCRFDRLGEVSALEFGSWIRGGGPRPARPSDDGFVFAINDHGAAVPGSRRTRKSRRGVTPALGWDATTTTAVTATAVTGGGPAGESADEDAGRAAAGDGRGHEPMRDLRREVGSRRSAPAAWADRPRDPVPHHHRHPLPRRNHVHGRAHRSTTGQAEPPTRTRPTTGSRRFAHQPARGSPRGPEPTWRRRPRRTEARTWTGDTAGSQAPHIER